MTQLQPQDLAQFSRQFQFAGGRILRIRYRFRKSRLDIDLVLRVKPSIKNLDDQSKPVRLHLRLTGVDEYRLQKRPAGSTGRIPDAHFGYLQSQFFVTLDNWSLLSGERPGVHDFRGSETYFACRDLMWEIVEPRTQ